MMKRSRNRRELEDSLSHIFPESSPDIDARDRRRSIFSTPPTSLKKDLSAKKKLKVVDFLAAGVTLVLILIAIG